LAIFAAIRRASSFVSSSTAELRKQPHAIEPKKFNSVLFKDLPDRIEISHLHRRRTVDLLAARDC
jgi:hypothetical protein